jgi:hypothetical protein
MFGEFELEKTLSPICEATVDVDEQGAFLLKQINVAAFINASLDSSLCPLIHHCCDVCLVDVVTKSILVSRLGELADARTTEKNKSFEERFNINKTQWELLEKKR